MSDRRHSEPEKFLRDLDADLSDPDCWPSLSEDRLCEVIGHAILAYAEFQADELIPYVARMYPFFSERVPAQRRFQLLQAITRRFSNENAVPDDDNRHLVDALLPFITLDRGYSIVATATLDFALLRGATSNPWLGVSQSLHMVDNTAVVNRPAILAGLIVLGDRRLTPSIMDVLSDADIPFVYEASKFQSEWVSAATVELCCEWLARVMSGPAERDPGGSVFGHVAAALYRLGTRAGKVGVAEISRNFPPQSPYEGLEIHRQWTQAEYRELLSPVLQELAQRETAPKVLPRVMDEWGI